MKITLNVNGQQHIVAVDLETPLLFVLNDELGLRGPRFGCGMAQCGACTVIMRGQAVPQFSKRLLRKEPPNAVFASAA